MRTRIPQAGLGQGKELLLKELHPGILDTLAGMPSREIVSSVLINKSVMLTYRAQVATGRAISTPGIKRYAQ